MLLYLFYSKKAIECEIMFFELYFYKLFVQLLTSTQYDKYDLLRKLGDE